MWDDSMFFRFTYRYPYLTSKNMNMGYIWRSPKKEFVWGLNFKIIGRSLRSVAAYKTT